MEYSRMVHGNKIRQDYEDGRLELRQQTCNKTQATIFFLFLTTSTHFVHCPTPPSAKQFFCNWLKATFLLLVETEVIYIDFQNMSLREILRY